MARRKSFLFALLLSATTALAQPVDSRRSLDVSKDVSENDQINNALPKQVALARCAYRQSGEGCPITLPTLETNIRLAQIPRRMGPIGPQGPPMRGPAYPETWGPQFSPGHALIGAAIGFGFGAAAGSKNGVRSSIAAGTLVGLLGAAIGAGIPSFPHYRRHVWDDDEEASLRKSAKPGHSLPDSAPQLASSQPGADRNISKE